MPSNIEAFIKETNAKIKKIEESRDKEAKEILVTAYTEIIDRSPVDTGLFMHNNLITINKSTDSTVDDKGDSKSEVMASAKAIIETMKFDKAKTLTIQNNLEYADALEAGHSSYAPDGVYGVTEELMRKILSKRKIVK